VEATRFDRLGIFTYSHEENTHAHTLTDSVPEKIKRKRADAVMAMQQEISYNLNQAKVGHAFKILVDRKEGAFFVGRTEFDSPDVDNEVLVKADSETYLRTGDFATVKIYEASDFDLYGKLVSAP
jgi:ribosomal protein S12 methylthiotransferase